MNRIFGSLALFSFLAVGGVMLLGLSLGDFQGSMKQLRELNAERQVIQSSHTSTRDEARLNEIAAANEDLQQLIARARMHRISGVAAALVVVLLYSILLTYFVGTGRWCKEVVETYQLNPDLTLKSAQIKRRAFMWAVLGMSWGVAIVALGAAADPSTGAKNTTDWVLPHFLGALLGLAWLLASFAIFLGKIRQQQSVINVILEQVRKVRAERGLEVDVA